MPKRPISENTAPLKRFVHLNHPRISGQEVSHPERQFRNRSESSLVARPPLSIVYAHSGFSRIAIPSAVILVLVSPSHWWSDRWSNSGCFQYVAKDLTGCPSRVRSGRRRVHERHSYLFTIHRIRLAVEFRRRVSCRDRGRCAPCDQDNRSSNRCTQTRPNSVATAGHSAHGLPGGRTAQGLDGADLIPSAPSLWTISYEPKQLQLRSAVAAALMRARKRVVSLPCQSDPKRSAAPVSIVTMTRRPYPPPSNST